MWFLVAKLAMRFFGNSAGAGYVVLNAIRIMNLISFVTVLGASGVLLAKTFEISGFGFFAALNHVLRIGITLFLVLSELNIFKNYYARHWPLFSLRHGFVMLGLTMLFLGINMFGELSHKEASSKKLGMPFWRLTLAAGILMVIMSTINTVASYIFRNTKVGVTARQVRAHGAAASKHSDIESVAMDSPKPNRATRYRSFFLRNNNSSNKEKRTSLPSYESTPRRGMNISSPISPATTASKYSHYPQGPISPEAAKHPAERHGNMI
jgi:hypothetical protein